MTYREAYEKGKRLIDSDEASNEALILLEYLMNTERSDLFSHPEREVDEETFLKFAGLIDRRNSGEPVQYITGKTYFFGLEFYCNRNVLIPRFDTEILVEEAIKRSPKGAKVLDLCTGSGIIALCVKHEREDLSVTGSDISEEALKVASKNKDNLSLDVSFVQSDMFENIDSGYDVLLSNPPYIRKEVIEGLDVKVKDYEPYSALCGGEDGLDFYRIIAEESRKFMKNNSLLIVEIGFDQGEEVKELFMENGFDDIEIIKDLNGLNRVVVAHLKQG